MEKGKIESVIILGSGGHSLVLEDALIELGYDIYGFITPDKEPGSSFSSSIVLGSDDLFTKINPDEVVLVNGIGALPSEYKRWQLAERMRSLDYNFITVIHPSAVVAKGAKLEEGVQVMAGAVIQTGTRVGLDSIINTGVLLDHDCNIEQNCHLAPGVVCSGGVNIGKGVHVGSGASVIQNISIGCNSIVAAGSIIYKNVPSNITVIQRKNTKYIKA